MAATSSRLTTARGYDAEAGYSPDGKKIVFSSTRSAYADNLTAEEKKLREIDLSYFGEIYIMNADGSGQTRLTQTPGYDGGPFFSPDGQRIVWRRFNKAGAVAEIHTMKIDGSDVGRSPASTRCRGRRTFIPRESTSSLRATSLALPTSSCTSSMRLANASRCA